MLETYTDVGKPLTLLKKTQIRGYPYYKSFKKTIETNLYNHVIHDLVATLLLFKRICTSKKCTTMSLWI